MNKTERKFLFKRMKRIPHNGVVVEVGSFFGDSSSRMFCEGIKKYKNNAVLHCVDTFNDDFFTSKTQTADFMKKFNRITRGRRVIEVFFENMQPYEYKLIREDSVDASMGFEDESIDLVFIDGDHTKEAVFRDISAWYPKVKYGGVICGHDYGKKQFGVTEVVDSFFKKIDRVVSSIWYVKKLEGIVDGTVKEIRKA